MNPITDLIARQKTLTIIEKAILQLWLIDNDDDIRNLAEQAAAELAALRAENKAMRELLEDLNKINLVRKKVGCSTWGSIYQERVDALLGLPFTEPSAVEPSEEEVKG